jgi:hypothetical protein
MSSVLDIIKKSTMEHPNFKKEININDETKYRYKFAHIDDPNRELIITVMVFDIPSD